VVWWISKGSVCSWGVQDHFFGVCVVVICGWLHSGIPSGFWGLDVALSVRVNQYNFLCGFSLSFISIISVLSCSYKLLIKTTGWIAKTTDWFSGNQLKQFCNLSIFIPLALILHWISLYLQSLWKTFKNNSPPNFLGLQY